MNPNRHIASLMLLILSLIAIHFLVNMTGKYNFSQNGEDDKGEVVLGISSDKDSVNAKKFHKVSVFYHRFFVPN